MKKILVPTDFSQPAENALEMAMVLAKKRGAAIHLLHSVDVPGTWQDAQWSTLVMANRSTRAQHELYPEARARIGAARQKLEAATMSLQKRGISSAYTLVPNAAWQEVVEATTRMRSDLVIMGTHGAGALKEAFLGSHAQRVIRSCTVPVLTLRHKWAGRMEQVALVADPMEKGIDKHLNRLITLLQGTRTRFHLLHVNTPGRFQDTGTTMAQLEGLANKLEAEVRLHAVDHYSPSEGGIDFAVREGMDLIALVTHGRTGANAFLNPSVAETIANMNPLPTLTLRVGGK
ncbi:MAG TPA: universal stress protein [Flavobacteriales bacterium]|nr:universal stress protein [Flavobacteriales bacterium]